MLARRIVAKLFLSFYCAACVVFAEDIRYAKNFSIENRSDYRLVTVNPATKASAGAQHYALVPKDRPLPKDLPTGWRVIRTPVERVVAMETVYIGHLEALGQLDCIVAAASVDYINNPIIRARLSDGRVKPIQIGQAIDIESLLTVRPDLILTSVSGDPTLAIPSRMKRTGLPIALSASYLEEHPLARAEWIKFIAAFVNETARAERIFADVEKRYLSLAALAADSDAKPTVFCGAPYSGTWHVPGGRSYTAQAIADAGGEYLWKETNASGSIPLDLERVFLKAAEADVWLNPSHYQTLGALLSSDPRFAGFAPAREGAVFNNTRRVSSGGGNAIWESGIVRPDHVLADLIHIFYPEKLPGHDPVYYEQLR